MTREQAKKLLQKVPAITAFADGKTIQETISPGEWMDIEYPGFCKPAEKYRVKPEPREWWVNVYADNCGQTKAYPTKIAAEQDSIHYSAECVHVREVI